MIHSKVLVLPTGSPVRDVLDRPVIGVPEDLETQQKVGNQVNMHSSSQGYLIYTYSTCISFNCV